MFCLCCNSSSTLSASRFFAEGLKDTSSDVATALQRRAAYERRKAYSRAPVIHPGQIEIMIRDVRALTMDPHVGELAATDIHLRGGEIVNIGRALQGSAMLEIDGRGLVALPGLVAAHRHLASDAIEAAGVDMNDVENEDMYRIIRLATLDLMSSGITGVHQCARGVPVGRAEMALLAQIDAGLRGCFSYQPSNDEEVGDMVSELAERWPAHASDGRVEVRLPEPQGSEPCGACDDVDLHECTLGAAQQLELDQWVGSLAPGKRADLILVDSAKTNAGLDSDRAAWSARDVTAANVVMVCVDGRVRKRNGVVVEPSEGLIRKEAQDAIIRLRNSINPLAIRS